MNGTSEVERKAGADFKVGDELIFLGEPKRLNRIEDYDTTNLLGKPYPGTRIAHGSAGFVITLFATQHYWAVSA